MPHDLLSDALAMTHLTGALFFRIDTRGPWGVIAAPRVDKLAHRLPRGTDHVIVFHVVIDGECWCRHASHDWFRIPAGCAVVLIQGDRHELADSPGRQTMPFERALGNRSLTDLRCEHFETGGGPKSSILCGFLGCNRRAFASLFTAMPALFTVCLEQRSKALLEYAARDALEDRPGVDCLRVRMAELLFMETLSLRMQHLPAGARGWLAGLRDPLVGRALHALHGDPSHDWTVDELAATIASSRSCLAARFRDIIGEPPIHYLTHLRMQLAARSLDESRWSIDRIASEVGYDSSAAFQRAFKRCYGVPPAAWRSNGGHGTIPRQHERRVRDRRSAG